MHVFNPISIIAVPFGEIVIFYAKFCKENIFLQFNLIDNICDVPLSETRNHTSASFSVCDYFQSFFLSLNLFHSKLRQDILARLYHCLG